jgi:hypothetical protein
MLWNLLYFTGLPNRRQVKTAIMELFQIYSTQVIIGAAWRSTALSAQAIS